MTAAYTSKSADKRGTKILIGTVALAGALTLVYFSSSPTLVCRRGPSAGVECEIRAKALGFIPVRDARVSGVDAVVLVHSAVAGSETPPRLTFIGDGVRDDLGYFAQEFTRDWQALDAFAKNPTTSELRLVRPFAFRPIAAHAAALFMLGISALVLTSAFTRRR